MPLAVSPPIAWYMEERAWFRLIRVWGPSLSAIWY